jgi:hypothetical protein
LTKFFLLGEHFIKKNILEYNKKVETSIFLKIPQRNVSIENEKVQERQEIQKPLVSVHKPLLEEPVLQNTKEPASEEVLPLLLAEEKHTVKEESFEPEIPKEPSKIAKYLTEFFAENLMAKI